MLQNASDRLIARNTGLEIATVRDLDLHVLPTPYTDASIFDFRQGGRLVELGHTTAAAWLAHNAERRAGLLLTSAGPQ